MPPRANARRKTQPKADLTETPVEPPKITFSGSEITEVRYCADLLQRNHQVAFPSNLGPQLILCNQIRRKLLDWYDLNHRVLPWRRNPHSKLAVTDPNLKCPPANLPLNEFMYYVWVCEVSHPSLEHTFSGSLGKIVFSPCKLGHVLCLLTSHANQRIEKCGSRSCHSKRSCHE